MENQATTAGAGMTLSAEATERARRVRATLPGQVLRDRLDTAAASYGPLYTLSQVQEKVGEALPMRVGWRRSAVLDRVQQYSDRIPDDALLRYDDARGSGLFAVFWVATPVYGSERQADPWILGEVDGTSLYAVIAHW